MRKYNAPKVKESRGIHLLTTIWLVPLIALIIALWLAFQYYAKIGAMIEITFKSNAGLIENQSPIKMRNVTVGIVKKISLSKEGDGVIIQARMNREVDPYLNNKAKFWIVHPEVGSQGVTGLDTIISGSYIEFHGKKETKTTYHYIGLEKPFIDEAKGSYYVLSAPQSYNISEGSKVYYRMIDIGRVVRVGISPDGSHVNFTLFVKEEYTPFINNRSKFYTRSAFNIDLTKGRLEMNVAPITQLVHGGIAIYTPLNTLDQNSTPLQEEKVFPLYKNLAEMKHKALGIGGESRIYKLTFNTSTKDLQIGVPVEFQGFQVGYVTEIENHYDRHQRVHSTVYALLYLDAFTQHPQQNSNHIIQQLVRDGLKAKLSTHLPVIGAQFIALVFDSNHPAKIVNDVDGYPIFPTLSPSPAPTMLDQLKRILLKVEKLPIEKLLNTLNSTIEENRKPIRQLLKQLNHATQDLNQIINSLSPTVEHLNHITANTALEEIPNNLNATLIELTATLQEIERLSYEYGGDSRFADQLSATLKAVTEASKSFDKTNKMLDRNPNALVVGDE